MVLFFMVLLRLSSLLPVVLIASAVAAQDGDIRVEFATATQQPYDLELQLSGTIEAMDSLDLGFRQSGRVVEVLAEEGDQVSAGQAMARLASVQQDQALNVARASLAAARAAQAQARQASDRARAMLERGVGTRAARDAAMQALSGAEGAVERAESQVEQARRAVDETVLRAPEAAVVTARNVAPGQIVGAAQPVLSLATTHGLDAVFQAPDHPLLREAMGRRVKLDTIDIDRPTMVGTVSEIAPLVDPRTGTVTLRAQIAAVEDSIALLGAAVRGSLRISTGAGVQLPWTVLMRQGDAPAVWLIDDDDRVRLVPVRIGQFADGAVFLSAGVEPGDRVVGAGSQLMYPGRKVRPAEARP
ncbi:efflux RND transporter periplasmic adaptor subunit [Paracoccus salsus]|uniref:efflux RND transporter periplasmic adaptor subunit n=1 Tax=Paracoccus salsus TaxID=2911061 RepID=UPI001F31EC75|nr:efflux RND transporter periplasmic adaptor subunit [Paracoccus salsus]MCF3972655.1 efflux RND transporter periplasmic adaptor subunit [Paracoccus salsus]